MSDKKNSYADGFMAANSPEVWRRLVGETIVGTFSNHDGSGMTQIWLVTGSGAAVVFNSTGSFWRASKEDVKRMVSKIKDELDRTTSSLQDILDTAAQVPTCRKNCCQENRLDTRSGQICGKDESTPFEPTTIGTRCQNPTPCAKHDCR